MAERPDVLMLGLRSLGAGQGGVETHVSELTSELDRLGVSVEAVVRTPYAGRKADTRGAATRITPVWSPTNAFLEAIVHSFLGILYAAWRRPRVVHIHAIGPALVTPLARLLGLRVVVTHHGEDYNREKWGRVARGMLRLGERAAAACADQAICISPSLTRQLNQRFDGGFTYIPNGVRAVQRVASTGVLDKLGLTPGGYVLHVGRIVPEKRQMDLIEAMGGIDRLGLKLVLVGAADHESDYSAQVLRAAADRPDVVLAGFQSGLALAELFSHAALFALPSSHEGLPIALLEALAYGLPAIASEIEANRNVALPAACYHRLADIADLRRAMLVGLAMPRPVDWRETLRAFDWQAIAAETVRVYGVDPHPALADAPYGHTAPNRLGA